MRCYLKLSDFSRRPESPFHRRLNKLYLVILLFAILGTKDLAITQALNYSDVASNNVLPMAERAVDPTTMNRKLLMGYQGWFRCPGDGSLFNRWRHWFRNNTPDAAHLTV